MIAEIMAEMEAAHGRGAGKQWTFLHSFETGKYRNVLMNFEQFIWHVDDKFEASTTIVDDKMKQFNIFISTQDIFSIIIVLVSRL